jgi:hypothetical protein
MHSNTAASRLVHEELLIGSVHLGKVGHIGQEDVHLDDLGHLGAGGGQDGLDVVAAGLSQVADVAGDEGAGGVGGDLAGDEDLAVGADGLGLGGGLVWFFGLDWIGLDWIGIVWEGVEGSRKVGVVIGSAVVSMNCKDETRRT